MELIGIIEKKDWKRTKALYREAFPAEERAPFYILKSRAKRGKADFWQIADGEIRAGFAYVISYKDLSYLFYFAVEPSLRGKGYGTAALNLLKEKYAGRRLFLAIEPLEDSAGNAAQRIGRHEFYLRCGFEDLPYRLKEASVVFSIMGIGGPVHAKEHKEMIEGYLGPILTKLVDMRIIEDDTE
jgi:GNAT superfamily N-acetyltransferase